MAAKQNHSQIDCVAFAVVFSVGHFFNYLFRRHFRLVTDNQPLTRIFYQNAKLPPVTSGQLLRCATFLSAFDNEVVFKKDLITLMPVVFLEPWLFRRNFLVTWQSTVKSIVYAWHQ
jgi:hypothetical protein